MSAFLSSRVSLFFCWAIFLAFPMRGIAAEAVVLPEEQVPAIAVSETTNSVSQAESPGPGEPMATVVAPANSPGTNQIASLADSATPGNAMPNVAGSLLRVMGMLAVVLALFLGGVWLFRNWQRFTMPRGQSPKLNILESRSLGGRHAILVVGYQQERFLVASSPAGVNLLTHLPSAQEEPMGPEEAALPKTPAFAETLAQMLKGKSRP
ncbi:MAG TPA: flagellar biosynthetic protein FliO [Verrucomicrobiae bacterium]|nr:flagellar biosynthetic protein FliO [Verrucomicrobiae bacterium]